ncbi:hypothetical protein V2J09_003921 [Rumex salicifolius]
METNQDSGESSTPFQEESRARNNEEKTWDAVMYTKDGSVDRHGRPAIKTTTGGWKSGLLILVNQGLATLAFGGVEVNMVLFSKSVLRQSNAEAANTFSRWMGTVYLFSLVGAFLSDSYLGRYLTCVVFQLLFSIGLIACSLVTHISLLYPRGCGTLDQQCDPHSPKVVAIFYISIYLIALGNGAPEPCLATFGSDQFDEDDPEEKQAKTSFFSYFYVALNLGSLIAETLLVYMESMGYWVFGFWISTFCGMAALVLLVSGTLRYRHFKPSGNPVSRFGQVLVASFRKLKLEVPSNGDGLYEDSSKDGKTTNGSRQIPHTRGLMFLDRAAMLSPLDLSKNMDDEESFMACRDPWRLCTITQVEEVKCVVRLIPIWLCTILSSVVFIQMLSLFVEQGAAMDTTISGTSFRFPPASMTSFDIISTSIFIIFYDKLIVPLYVKLTKKEPEPPSELQRIGIGLAIAVVAMVIAGFVEQHRRRFALPGQEISTLSIFWQIPQYVLVGVSEAFVYVAQWEFFASQTPDSLKSIGLSLSMSSSAIGSYICSIILSVVMDITTKGGKPGWVPQILNDGHLDKFFFLSAMLTAANLGMYVICARRYKSKAVEKDVGAEMASIA